jgi:diguanylate cyclase (GGDEF)-like protein
LYFKLNKTNTDNEEIHQLQVVPLFALVGLFITAILGIKALFNSSFILASTLFIASSIYFIGYYAFKKYGNVKVSANIILYSLYLLMFYLVLTGGVSNTGPLWIYIVAPVSLFLHGLKRGLLDLTIFLFVISLLMFIPIDFINHAEYTSEFKLRLIYSFLTTTFLSAMYEYSRDRSYKDTLKLSQKYEYLANFDPLTRLSNRRNALTVLQQEQARLNRNKEPLSLILCDVDHFKNINDKYGHNAGDAVLVELANIFKSIMREQDCIARWGGEEFLFILPQTTAENAHVIGQKILTYLQQHTINYNDNKISVKVSMGISQFKRNQSIDDVINSADRYLYQAKDAGRNQIQPKL